VLVTASAADAKDPLPDVPFDHLYKNRDQSYSLRLADGEEFTVRIQNTFPGAFEYTLAGIEKATETEPPVGTLTGDNLEPVTIERRHEKKYGGYILKIKRTAEQPVVVDDVTLNDVTLLIFVETEGWRYGFAGAFTVSGLTDRVYAVDNGQAPRHEDKEDVADLGFGAFIHVYHSNHPKWAGTFGLGIEQTNETTYYFGFSFRASDKAAATVGVALGSVEQLSASADPNDPNVLADVDSRLKASWFFAVSYTFFDVRQFLEKPFAGTGSGG
jgi:hypothetical protein